MTQKAKRSYNLPHFFAIWILAASCAGVSVKSDYDQEYNFAGLNSYAWAHNHDKNDGKEKSLIKKRIQKYAGSALQTKGYKLVPKEQADFLVDYSYTSKEVLVPAAIQPSIGFGFGSRYYGSGYGVGVGYGFGGYDKREVETLAFDVWDAKTKEHIWSAGAETNLVGSNAEETDENFREAVAAIMAKFPPGRSEN